MSTLDQNNKTACLENDSFSDISISSFIVEESDVSCIDELRKLSSYLSTNDGTADTTEHVSVQQSNITKTSKCTDNTVNPPSQHMYKQKSMSTNIFSWLDKTETWNMEEKRKHSHNLVERRRRFRINDKIKELETLLPGRNRSHSFPQNKSSILTATVDYIKQIQAEQERICLLEERQRRMEQQIIKIIKVLQCIQRGLVNEQTVKHVGKCTEMRTVSKFNIKGYIPIYQAQYAEDDNDENIKEIYSSFEELDVDQEHNNLSNL